MVSEKLQGQLESPFQETYFVTINDKYGYMGKLDECLIDPEGKYIPVDFKTASSDPTTRELIPAYQFQLDSYAFLLDRNRKRPGDVGHLIYFYPDEGKDLHHGFPMQVTIKTLHTNPDRLPAAIDEAMALLNGPLPTPAPDCKFCLYVETVKEF
jgi:CRISPR/Cas system-associated exonuclease Cas4 (RecB family)